MLTINDLCYSDTAVKHGIENKPASYAVKWNLTRLVRVLNCADISSSRILSGYRCPGLNKLVGGAPLSAHLKGNAVDISCENVRDCLDTLTVLYLAATQLHFYVSYFYMSRSRHKIHIDFTFV